VTEPTQFVDADDPIVADLLPSTLELVAEAGGWMSPRARIIARDGQLRIECHGEPDGPLLRIPQPAWVRVDAVTWADDATRLAIADVPDDIGDIELEMLYTLVALHNQCGKLPWIAQTHPSLAPDLPDDVVGALRALVPGFRSTPSTPRDVLFSNRCFRMSLDGQPSAQRVLVPLVDLLNHHRAGAVGTVDSEAFHVQARQPFGSAECALDYGMDRDALEMAVVYGFADASVDAAHSAPVLLEVPGVGPVHILGSGRSDTGALLPVTSGRSGDATTLSRLTFRLDEAQSAVDDVMHTTGWDRALSAQVAHAAAEANAALLDTLLRACTATLTASVAIVDEAARRQRAIVYASTAASAERTSDR
jgi:hypothetical protein